VTDSSIRTASRRSSRPATTAHLAGQRHQWDRLRAAAGDRRGARSWSRSPSTSSRAGSGFGCCGTPPIRTDSSRSSSTPTRGRTIATRPASLTTPEMGEHLRRAGSAGRTATGGDLSNSIVL